jgi:hypothetical protein
VDSLQVALNPVAIAQGRLTGDWKVVIGSSAKIRAAFKAPQLYTVPDLASFEFLLEAEAGAISFGTNKTVGDCADVDVCIGQRLIAVLRGSSLNHEEAEFLAALENQDSGSHFGATIRWAVNTISSTAFSLDLQGLPMTAATAQGKPNLKTETAPTVKLCSFPVSFEMCGPEFGSAGPLPALFAADPSAVMSSLRGSLEPFTASHKRLTWHLMNYEYVDLSTALGFIKRAREGKVSRPFHAEVSDAASLKRPVMQSAGPAEPASGKNKISKIRKFPSYIPSTFVFAILSAISENLTASNHAKNFEQAILRVSQSISLHTWARYESAWHSFVRFCEFENIAIVWPIPLKLIRLYVLWADGEAGLSASTIKAYLSALSQLQSLTGLGKGEFVSDSWIKILLKGKENAKVYEFAKVSKRKPVTFEILQLIGHQIMSSNWPEYTKNMIWSLSLVAFWGSFRIGELLTSSQNQFDNCTNLTWNDILFKQDGSVVIRIKSPKNAIFPGHFVDLFPCSQDIAYCPIYYLKNLKLSQAKLGIHLQSFSPFILQDGSLFASNQFIHVISDLLEPLGVLNETDVITGHSFRFGIPSTLAALRDPELSSDVSIWGRWTSSAYQSYVKLVTDQKRKIFERISHYLFNKNSQ